MKKTERLLLNTTSEERAGMLLLRERARVHSDAEMMREAFTLYLSFHRRIFQDEEIFVSARTGGGHSIYIPKKWEDPEYKDIDQESQIGTVPGSIGRKVLEIRLEKDFKKELEQFVADGYAPSLTALAGASLEIFSSILTASEEGGKVCSRRRDGKEVVLIEPKRRHIPYVRLSF